jgi:hypothetical protein
MCRIRINGALHLFAFGPALCCLLPACSMSDLWRMNAWISDYQNAERRQQESGRQMLIFYRDPDPEKNRAIARALRSRPVRSRLQEYILCALYREYEPDRRYMDQFDVRRSPALVAAWADGAYRARSGLLDQEDILALLDSPREGANVRRNSPYLLYDVKYDWVTDFDSACELCGRSGARMLIVLHRAFTSDFARMSDLLEDPVVYRRFADDVHCRLGTFNGSCHIAMERYGVKQLPAIVLVEPGGQHKVLEMPVSSEAIVRFASLSPGNGLHQKGAPASTATP